MGCGSSSAKEVSPAPQKPLQPLNGTLKKNHSDTQNTVKESTQTNGLIHTTKEEKYDKNGNEKPKNTAETNQDLIKSTENQENDKNILNSSKINGKYGSINWLNKSKTSRYSNKS